MAEDRFPMEFKKCPYCGCEDTVTELAMQEAERTKGIKREGPFVSFDKKAVFLYTPTKLARMTVPALLIHLDICAGCGCERVTRAELQDAPMQAQMPPQGGGQRGFIPPGYGGDPRRQ